MAPNKKYLGEFEQMILAAVLRLGEQAYGVAILDEIAARTGREVSSGALSITLDRMEKKGYVRSELDDSNEQRGGRPRRYIRISAPGLVAAGEARDAMLSLWGGIEEAFEDR